MIEFEGPDPCKRFNSIIKKILIVPWKLDQYLCCSWQEAGVGTIYCDQLHNLPQVISQPQMLWDGARYTVSVVETLVPGGAPGT